MSKKTSLHIILVLSFIGSGFSFVAYILMGLSLPYVRQMLDSGSMRLPEEMMVAYETVIAAPQAFYLISGIFYGLSLIGAILMWKLSRTGFHCYTLAQLVLLAIPVLFLGKAFFAIGDAMMTLLFVVYYFFTLRSLGVFSAPDSDVDGRITESDEPDNDENLPQ